MSHNDPTPGSGFPGSCSSEGKAGKGGVEACFFVKAGMALWLTVIDPTHSLVFKYIWFIVDTWYFSRQNLTMFVGPLLGLQMWSVKSWPAARHGQGRPTTSQWLAVKPTWLARTWLARPFYSPSCGHFSTKQWEFNIWRFWSSKVGFNQHQPKTVVRRPSVYLHGVLEAVTFELFEDEEMEVEELQAEVAWKIHGQQSPLLISTGLQGLFLRIICMYVYVCNCLYNMCTYNYIILHTYICICNLCPRKIKYPPLEPRFSIGSIYFERIMGEINCYGSLSGIPRPEHQALEISPWSRNM